MNKTETHVEYAAFVRRSDGSWHKLNVFWACRSITEAEHIIQRHKHAFPEHENREYKISRRAVTITREDWHDLED